MGSASSEGLPAWNVPDVNTKREPLTKAAFVIYRVPCYTEGEISLRRTIDLLAQLKHDDKRKLILVICDANIVGSSNDRPTPPIVFDILGADPSLLPRWARLQRSIMCAGYVVPYLVVVKIGKPSEHSRPGNHGKCDSQMVIMHFLNKLCCVFTKKRRMA
ncbi:hypothetical protein K503DRAFT_841616 [Rhizopogon vinicolor AM-OR11-026]|uniref:Uncharacterized protein n=1 Tax=Rhizopogon vinicolor AM-OR11-026 TaxID=1314800 RepID=A0A1B7MJK7_9AGAM|nr:hypothetical protein K503DRAFT_841616 [Rhizopogon vinicolor AM-OR11-026]